MAECWEFWLGVRAQPWLDEPLTSNTAIEMLTAYFSGADD